MGMPSLNPVMRAAERYSAQAGQAGTQLGAIATQQGAIANESTVAQTAIGGNNATILAAQSAGQLKTEANIDAIATMLGTNLDASTQVMAGLAETIQQSYAAKAAALEDVQKKQSVGFFDNPLEWIINQFTVNDDIAKHNAANAKLQAAQDQMQTLNTLTSSGAAAQNVQKKTITQASAVAASDNARLAATITANKDKIEGLTFNAQAITAALNATKEQLGAASTTLSAQFQQANLQIALDHLALSREKFAWEKEAKKKGEDADLELIDSINKGRQILYGPEADLIIPGTAKASNLISLMRSGNPIDPALRHEYLTGQQTTIAGGNKILAGSPAQAVELFSEVPRLKLGESADQTRALILKVTGEVLADPALDKKNKQAVSQAINTGVKSALARQAANINPADGNNIFNIPTIRQLMAVSPVVAELPIVKKLLGPALQSGAELSTPDQIFSYTAKALKQGKISYTEALELTTYYQTGMRVNNAAKQFTALGIAPPLSYNTDLKLLPQGFFNSETVDLTKPDQVGRALNKYLAARLDNPLKPQSNFPGARNPFAAGVTGGLSE